MSNRHNTDHGKQNSQDARNAESAKDNFDKATDQTVEHGKQFADAAREGANKMVDVSEKAAETTKEAMQNGFEIASQQAREAADLFSKTLGFSGQDSERLAEQSKQNIEAITRCSTVLNQAFQDASRSLFNLGQKQFQRNLEGLNKLTQAKSVQEFAAIQSDFVRDGLQHMVQDSRAITDTSARAVEEAGKTFSSVAQGR